MYLNLPQYQIVTSSTRRDNVKYVKKDIICIKIIVLSVIKSINSMQVVPRLTKYLVRGRMEIIRIVGLVTVIMGMDLVALMYLVMLEIKPIK